MTNYEETIRSACKEKGVSLEKFAKEYCKIAPATLWNIFKRGNSHRHTADKIARGLQLLSSKTKESVQNKKPTTPHISEQPVPAGPITEANIQDIIRHALGGLANKVDTIEKRTSIGFSNDIALSKAIGTLTRIRRDIDEAIKQISALLGD